MQLFNFIGRDLKQGQVTKFVKVLRFLKPTETNGRHPNLFTNLAVGSLPKNQIGNL